MTKFQNIVYSSAVVKKKKIVKMRTIILEIWLNNNAELINAKLEKYKIINTTIIISPCHYIQQAYLSH